VNQVTCDLILQDLSLYASFECFVDILFFFQCTESLACGGHSAETPCGSPDSMQMYFLIVSLPFCSRGIACRESLTKVN
jgi:hypothetical protein